MRTGERLKDTEACSLIMRAELTSGPNDQPPAARADGPLALQVGPHASTRRRERREFPDEAALGARHPARDPLVFAP